METSASSSSPNLPSVSILREIFAGLKILAELVLEITTTDFHVVKFAVLHRPESDHLCRDGERVVLVLVEHLDNTLASSSCWVFSSRSEPNCAKAASSRNCARSSFTVPATCFIALICAAEPTRKPTDPLTPQGARPDKTGHPEEDLSVSDGNHVGWDVRRYVTGLRLDDRQGGE